METFFVIDPAAARRAVLKVFLHPEHRVVEGRTLQAEPASADQAFKAVFIAWPSAVPSRESPPGQVGFSCEHVVLMIEDAKAAATAEDWLKRAFPASALTLMHCPDGYISAGELSRALSRVLQRQSVVFPELAGSSLALRQVLESAAKLALTDRPVLLCGEPGTGKETLARWLHARSPRGQAGARFETFHCPQMDPAAAFSELFGHEKGAFSWAAQPKPGLLTLADQGTLYIHELCDLDTALQVRLLRVLDCPAAGVERLGGRASSPANVRFIAASRWPLRQRLGQDVYEELFYRFAQHCVEVPPLRSRSGDIPELARYFITRQIGQPLPAQAWDPQVLNALQQYPWPGNLNELDAALGEAMLRAGGPAFRLEHLPAHIRQAAGRPRWFAPTPAPVEPAPKAAPAAVPAAGESTEPDPRGPGPHALSPKPFPDRVERDGYNTVRTLAETRWTKVFLAQREFTGDLVILKLLRLREADQAQAMKRAIALHERRSGAKDFMIPIYHANLWAEGPLYILVEACLDCFVAGREIIPHLYRPNTFQHWTQTLWNKGHLTPQEKAALLEHLGTMLGVLDFFHGNQLVMNDVKPANFGFYEQKLRMIDYGGITFVDQPAHENTKGYGPPERRLGLPAEDVFAVVQMMGEALYGYDSLDIAQVEELAKDYEKEGNLFDKLAWTIMAKGMNKNPKIRFQSARNLAKPLAELKLRLKEDQQ